MLLFCSCATTGVAIRENEQITVGYSQRNVTDAIRSYSEQLKEKMFLNWVHEDIVTGAETTIMLQIAKDGKIVKRYIDKSSGIDTYDKAALSVIDKMAPYAPLPAGYTNKTLRLYLYFRITDRFTTDYLYDVNRRIMYNWPYTEIGAKTGLKVEFRINRDGTLRSNKIVKSSGDRQYDQEAVQAVIDSAPFKPLPDNYKKETFGVLYYFSPRRNTFKNVD